MKTQQQRDEQTVTIAMALAVMLGAFTVGVLGILTVGALTDMSRAFDAAILWVGLAATALAGAYLIRTEV